MGRKPRVEYYGAVYHIIQRGQFNNDDDKIDIIGIIGEVKEIFDFNILAYSIMDNQYNLVIKTLNVSISQIMHRINTRYAKCYNKKHDRTGPLFEERYRAVLVNNESYLFGLINYIHNNPVYGNLVMSMEEYKWSSDFFYRINLENIVDIDYILNMLNSDREESIKRYKELMNIPNEDYVKLKHVYEYSDFIGEDTKIDLDKILKSICSCEKDYNLIKLGSRKAYLIPYKYRYIMECKELGCSNSMIGHSICIGDRSVRRYLVTNLER